MLIYVPEPRGKGLKYTDRPVSHRKRPWLRDRLRRKAIKSVPSVLYQISMYVMGPRDEKAWESIVDQYERGSLLKGRRRGGVGALTCLWVTGLEATTGAPGHRTLTCLDPRTRRWPPLELP